MLLTSSNLNQDVIKWYQSCRNITLKHKLVILNTQQRLNLKKKLTKCLLIQLLSFFVLLLEVNHLERIAVLRDQPLKLATLFGTQNNWKKKTSFHAFHILKLKRSMEIKSLSKISLEANGSLAKILSREKCGVQIILIKKLNVLWQISLKFLDHARTQFLLSNSRRR